MVLVDAATPGAGYFAQREFLLDLAGGDGWLPPWTSWWDEGDVGDLFPDAEVRARIEAEQPRMPLANYDHVPPARDGWDRLPCAYVWFGGLYETGAERAAARGWPARQIPGNHLHMLSTRTRSPPPYLSWPATCADLGGASCSEVLPPERGAMSLFGKRADLVVHESEPFNAEPTPAALNAAFITPVDTFYSRNHGPVPDIDAASWRLTVTGRVARELELSLDDLQTRFPTQNVTATLQCAGNRRAGLIAVREIPGEHPWGQTATSTAEWTGVRLGDVLAEAGVDEGARHVAFDAPDVSEVAKPRQAYGSSIPIEKAVAREVLLAWQMNGEPLTAVHGAPVRVVVPGYIGARSVKWLERITVRADPSDNYFQASAYRLLPADADADAAGPGDGISLGPIALNSAILAPAEDATVAAGPVEVSGYAFAGGERPVARVDVSVDGGRTWTQADLGEDRGRWSWRRWRAEVELPAGQIEIAARAWDAAAGLQPESAVSLWNPKGYVNNSWARAIVHAESLSG